MKEIRTNKPLRILLVTNAMILMAGGLLGPIYALFVEEIGGDLLDAGIAGFVFAIAAGITVVISGKKSDASKHPEYIVALGYCIMGAGYLLYLFVHSMTSLLLVQVLIGFGEALYLPAFDALYSIHLDKNNEGGEWGEWESMNYFATAAAALIGGFVAEKHGFILLFLMMSLLCLLSGLYTQELLHGKRK
ncbi:hypothetical protein COU78_02725 [Candidatus Peregrinibacteria bacterium CG10_big_fil_rev_8_21_14_0_10_49_24]|nr:MAG: hypothetical protein COV83_02705 [Candidatus Peregrinibacteria bacterium CG11_big_fil_rev_8_21_14_0_20_49_14]PIR51050.1 MAG: hypothetical protein COU78_02725 [Candidatus Peregrinibacteria bacterium CG10_big_fil_rev_8_21_14_0_10_49_24]PJA67603.1 MAG: hypothetical protein CO157_04205 [Candidatus Peregrinibacteria bacterium CG_4_9_14_3_um_filter_49_12]